MWQARIGATACFTGDGTRKMVPSGDKDDMAPAVGRATIRHDGKVFGGAMCELDAECNYTAELAALLDGLESLPAGGRVVIMLDATSPVCAYRAWKRKHARKRTSYIAATWFDHLERLVNRQEAVVFWWQTSHVGSPMNEAADVEADKAREVAEGLISSADGAEGAPCPYHGGAWSRRRCGW